MKLSLEVHNKNLEILSLNHLQPLVCTCLLAFWDITGNIDEFAILTTRWAGTRWYFCRESITTF